MGNSKRPRPARPCCLVSEMLEELGLDRARARALRRQILEGIILLCQWQLERVEDSAPTRRRKRAAKVDVE